jgi:hypothetical protein
MYLVNGNIETLLACVMLTTLAAFLTVVLSVICGATLAFHARPTIRYGVALAVLFVPFALGDSVWAFSVSRWASWCGLQGELVSSGTFGRATALLFFCFARTLPLGTFFCVTTLQRYTSEIRPYFQSHQLSLSFFLLCGLNRVPKSILMLLGLFGGAMMSSEASLATFLYRANPGTEPETVNILLARLFREIYASAGPESLSRVATLGVVVSLLLLLAALFGTWAGRGMLGLIRHLLGRSIAVSGTSSAVFSILSYTTMILSLAPGILALVGLLIPVRLTGLSQVNTLEIVFNYRDIVALGALVGGTITTISIAIAVRLRYSRTDLLALLESKPIAACLLLLPAFVPVLSVVALLGKLSHGQMAGVPGYVSLFISHVALHYSVFQFICMALVAAIPERHVAWQRTMKMSYSFSLVTDGFRRHAAVIVSLIGLGTVQVVTDGSISRWYSHLVKAPEEALYAAVFGRLSSAAEAVIITWSVGIVAITVCAVLASAYVRELKGRPRYA